MQDNRCMRCMRERGAGRFCKNCGFDNENPKNPERALPIGTILNGKYLIGAVIGEGGFGITYVAWDTFIQTRIAIKEYFPSELVTRDTGSLQDTAAVLKLTLIQERARERYRKGLARFVEEAGNLARFGQLPGIASVKDFFYENDTAYMVMEYIEGTTLAAYLDNSRKKPDVEKTLRMMEPVIKTLGEIHKAGVIHRDISPDNIMVTSDGQIKLIDFGAARFVGGESEKSLTVMLKHGYAPEEQYRSEGKQGAWTDVYALCAVIYRMLTGKAPEETAQRILEKQDAVHGELMRVPNLPGQVRKGIERGLSVRADKRFQTMGELYKGLYKESRGNSWKWVMRIDAVLLFAVCILVFAVRNRRLEPDTAVAGSVWEKWDMAELVEGEEKEREEEEQTTAVMEEPEYIPSYSEEELMTLVVENSGKFMGETCYDDFDGDGRYELFAYVAEKIDEENGSDEGCSIWFSDGEKTMLVQDIADGWYVSETGVLQFGKEKHFYLYRTGILASMGSAATTCALEDGVPHTVIQDQQILLSSENGKTYCDVREWEPYDRNASGRYIEKYTIFYMNGEYWEYASVPVSEDELLKYTNGEEIIDEIKGIARELYLEGIFTYDFSRYPYIEVENVLLNSENQEFIVNMRNWISKEEADYFKNLTEDELGDELVTGDVPCMPSEARLSTENNTLQIEEVSYGHKEENGTEFRPFYPE